MVGDQQHQVDYNPSSSVVVVTAVVAVSLKELVAVEGSWAFVLLKVSTRKTWHTHLTRINHHNWVGLKVVEEIRVLF